MTVVIDGETLTLAQELEVTSWDDRRVESATESRAIVAFASYLGSQRRLRLLSERLGRPDRDPDSFADPTERASWRRALARVDAGIARRTLGPDEMSAREPSSRPEPANDGRMR